MFIFHHFPCKKALKTLTHFLIDQNLCLLKRILKPIHKKISESVGTSQDQIYYNTHFLERFKLTLSQNHSLLLSGGKSKNH